MKLLKNKKPVTKKINPDRFKILTKKPINLNQPKTKNLSDSFLITWMRRFRTGVVILFTGLVKEFNRVTWLKGKKLWSSYATVITITVLFAVLFYIISIIAKLF